MSIGGNGLFVQSQRKLLILRLTPRGLLGCDCNNAFAGFVEHGVGESYQPRNGREARELRGHFMCRTKPVGVLAGFERVSRIRS